MRPLRLRLKGFTAFREEVEVDFAGLDVFALSGPTGSGKSSLLDAMTYALYGRVERVGDRVRYLISQGQPRMVVTLEFEVGRDRYRVTRSTPARGPTKVLLEVRGEDGTWRPAGEGADRVGEVEAMVVRAVGLSYDGFTRSVLLPQGRFAEFLVGDASKRRDILTELLGLSLFRRLQEKANQLAREADLEARTKGELVEREYAGVSEGAVARAREEAARAREEEGRLRRARRALDELARRWEAERRRVEELRGLTEEVAGLAGAAGAAARELAELAGRASRADRALEQATAREEEAARALEAARAARVEAERELGSLPDLLRAQGRAEELSRLMGRAAEVGEELDAVKRAVPELDLELEGRRAELEAARSRVEEAERAVAEAEGALERVTADQHVAALVAGRSPGDPCPVCGRLLRTLPRPPRAGEVERARQALERAREEARAAQRAVVAAERAFQAAAKDREARLAAQQRLAGELARAEAERAARAAELEAVLGSPLPSDPGAELVARVARIRALEEEERAVAELATEAERARREAESERIAVTSAVADQRGQLVRLAADLEPVLERAARAAGEGFRPPRLPAPPRSRDPSRLADQAGRLARALGEGVSFLQEEAERAAASGQGMLGEAAALVGDLVEGAGTVEEVRERVEAAAAQAGSEATAAELRAADLEERLGRLETLRAEVEGHRARADRFRALATELRADRIIAFLQSEALQLLALAASERLSALSEGRYRIGCREDEFVVVDTWNGDEERSVRTLSGGETFLASLSLALALAEHVRSLAVTDRARLDSLFLDEGFGTLDQESLRVVVEAVERLGGDGRLVGVVTHIQELAEQFPRIEVEKSPRGSRLRLVTS